MTFQQLHQQDKPLLIGNVWDVASENQYGQFRL